MSVARDLGSLLCGQFNPTDFLCKRALEERKTAKAAVVVLGIIFGLPVLLAGCFHFMS